MYYYYDFVMYEFLYDFIIKIILNLPRLFSCFLEKLLLFLFGLLLFYCPPLREFKSLSLWGVGNAQNFINSQTHGAG